MATTKHSSNKVALTRIKHGLEDGEVIIVDEGESVDELPADVVKDLTEKGFIGEPPVTQAERDKAKEALEGENEELQAQVEALKAELAEAKKAKTA